MRNTPCFCPLYCTGLILGLCFSLAFVSRCYSMVRYEVMIHEFDPWFNYRSSKYLETHGLLKFLEWFDKMAWHPHGRSVGSTVYPGLMVVTVLLKQGLQALNLHLSLTTICAFIAPTFSCLTVLYTYKITKEVSNERAALISALLVGLAPGYMCRSVIGSYDNEAIAITLLISTFYYWVKAVRRSSLSAALLAGVSYSCMAAAWGGYQYITNLISLHVFALLLLGRFTSDLYIVFSAFFIAAQSLSTLIPCIYYRPFYTIEHYALLFAMVLLQCAGLKSYLYAKCISILASTPLVPQPPRPPQPPQSQPTVRSASQMPVKTNSLCTNRERFSRLKNRFKIFARKHLSIMLSILIYGGFLVGLILAYLLLSKLRLVSEWADRYTSLWGGLDPRNSIPLVASIAEHQSATWSSFFFDLHVMPLFFAFGMYLSFKDLSNDHIFLIVYGLTALYFSCVMIRIILILTPIACIYTSIALENIFSLTNPFAKGNKLLNAAPSILDLATQQLASILIGLLLIVYIFHCSMVASEAYSSPSYIFNATKTDNSEVYVDDYREAYQWIREKTPLNAKIMAWWDYGYHLQGMSDRATLTDNNTNNYLHISLVALAFASTENNAIDIIRYLGADYVVVTYEGIVRTGSDDLSKFPWIAKIAEGDFPDLVSFQNYVNNNGTLALNKNPNRLIQGDTKPSLQDTLLYKLVYHRMHDLQPYDRSRKATPDPVPKGSLSHLKEVYTSTYSLVRIYKVVN